MIARDDTTRAILNQQARELLTRAEKLSAKGVTIVDQDFRVGDRVIARRNDRRRDMDNGTLATVAKIDRHTETLTVVTDSGEPRPLDAAYAAEHLEHGYAPIGHGAQGTTVTWAAVLGRPSKSTREWASQPYPAHARARA